MKNYLLLFIVALFIKNSFAQNIMPTAASARMKALGDLKTSRENSILKNWKFTNIGPTIMSGRVVDIEVNPINSTEFYVAYASGGLWYTNNNGQSFSPLFDNQESITIGDVAVDWLHHIIWVGTGENNSSRSSYAGTGIYKSTDQGKTWTNVGLQESHHIGKILLNDGDVNTALVAVIGHLYTYNNERGIFKTIDGGMSWKKVLSVDDTTGCIDLQQDVLHKNIFYAAMWHRERKPWNFVESGATSGIYKSEDSGETWKLISTSASGFPQGNGIGRIGISVFKKNTTIVYAIVDNQNNQPAKENDATKITSRKIRTMNAEDFLKTDSIKMKSFLNENDFPAKYSYSFISSQIKNGKLKPVDIANYVSDADNDLFDTPVKGAEIYRSEDAGVHWKKMNKTFLDGLYNTYGYYFGKIFLSPTKDSDVYVLGVPLLKSSDGGQTFHSIEGDNQHGDHHVLWLDPQNPKHIINGNDGGVNITYDDGKHWLKCNTPAVGQFYSIAVDDAKPYNVYGGLQDNGVWSGPSTTTENTSWHEEGQYAYKRLYGGDGMQVQVDTRDNNTVYTGYQFGHYARLNKQQRRQELEIHPVAELGEPPFRFCWQTPICLSKHNQDILYMGSNRFHRSLQQGNKMETLSADLTNGKKIGDVPYGTITTIAESPMKFGFIYTGTDDGNVYVSKDVGYNFTKINNGLPQGLRVMKITPSKYNEAKVYVAMSAFQFDNFTPYLFVSNDFGITWNSISSGLPPEPVNVIKEDPRNENIIYVGTDNGLYVSLNGGKTYSPASNLPRVAIHDMAIQERENELVIGTHGRSIYKAKLDEVQLLADSVLLQNIVVFKEPTFWVHNNYWGKKWSNYEDDYLPTAPINFYSKEKEITRIDIATENGVLLKTFTDSSEVGLNYVRYNLTIDSTKKADAEKFYNSTKKKSTEKIVLKRADNGNYYLLPGNYVITVSQNNFISKKNFEIEKDKHEEEEGKPERE